MSSLLRVWRQGSRLMQFVIQRRCFRALIVLMALGLSGCGGSASPSSPVPLAILAAVVEQFRRTRGWKFRSDSDNRSLQRRRDRHRGFFVRRRASTVGERHPAWIAEVGQPKLLLRIESELAAVEAYLEARLGSRRNPGPLGGGEEEKSPPHLDILDVAKPLKSTGPRSIATNAAEYRRLRRTRVTSIVYRAAALHDILWTEANNGLSAMLRMDAMDEIVDRRLRAIERLNFQIGNPNLLGNGRIWQPLIGATGPWRDGFRVRMIEYPRLAAPLARFVSAIGPSHIAAATAPRFEAGKPWRYSQTGRRLEYNVGPAPGAYFPPPVLAADVTPVVEPSITYMLGIVPTSGRTAADAIQTMFNPTALPGSDAAGGVTVPCNVADRAAG